MPANPRWSFLCVRSPPSGEVLRRPLVLYSSPCYAALWRVVWFICMKARNSAFFQIRFISVNFKVIISFDISGALLCPAQGQSLPFCCRARSSWLQTPGIAEVLSVSFSAAIAIKKYWVCHGSLSVYKGAKCLQFYWCHENQINLCFVICCVFCQWFRSKLPEYAWSLI